jgi:ankyrin repeat protein
MAYNPMLFDNSNSSDSSDDSSEGSDSSSKSNESENSSSSSNQSSREKRKKEADQRRLDMQLLNTIQHNKKEKVKALISSGANINADHPGYFTPLFLAIKTNNSEMVQLLLSYNDIQVNWQTPLFEAIMQENVVIAKLLLAHPKISVSIPSSFNNLTPLHLCAGGKCAELITRLLANPAVYLGSKDNKKETPLDVAIRYNQITAIALLLKHTTVISQPRKIAETLQKDKTTYFSLLPKELCSVLSEQQRKFSISDKEARKALEKAKGIDIPALEELTRRKLITKNFCVMFANKVIEKIKGI